MAGLSPYDRHMGFRAVDGSPDGFVLEVDPVAGLTNPTGVLHGGVLSGLADAAMGLTVTARVAGATATNTDLHVRFLRPVRPGGLALRATARVLKEGRRTLVLAADIHQGDVLVATASSTFLVLGPAGVPEGNTQTR